MSATISKLGAFALLAVVLPAQADRAKPEKFKPTNRYQRDWDRIPFSDLGRVLSEACDELLKEAAGEELRCVVTPIQCNRSKVNTWRAESHVQRLLEKQLSASGHRIVPVAPFLADLDRRHAKRRKRKRSGAIKYTTKTIEQVAETTGATSIVIGNCKFGGKKTVIKLWLYGGKPWKRLASHDVTLATREFELLRNTPAANRKVIRWVENQFGKKVDRGECWDLANRAFVVNGIRRAGGTTKWGALIPLGGAVLPGDIIQWNRKETGGQHHTVVVHHVRPDGRLEVLHQNWAGGAERGRIVGPGGYRASGLTKARIYRPIPSAKR